MVFHEAIIGLQNNAFSKIFQSDTNNDITPLTRELHRVASKSK